MLDVLLEGIRASIEPCSLALILPAIGATLLGGRRAWAVALGLWIAAAGLAWAQASILLDIGRGPAIGIVLAVVALVGAALLWRARRDRGGGASGGGRSVGLSGKASGAGGASRGRTALALGAGVLIGTAAGLLWRPCVGPELGTILTAAPGDPGGQLLPLVTYLFGVLLITALLAAVPALHDRAPAILASIPISVVAVVPLIGLATILATGQYETIIGRLVQASSL